MPALKRTDRQLRISSMAGVIKKYQTLYGYNTHDKVGEVLGLSRTGYYIKRKSPEKWTVGELDALMRVLHIPPHELLKALYDCSV